MCNTLSHFAKASRDTLHQNHIRFCIQQCGLPREAPVYYWGEVWRCRVLSSGPNRVTKNFYKRSPFYFPRLPINGQSSWRRGLTKRAPNVIGLLRPDVPAKF